MLKKFLPKSAFAKNVVTLMTGTGLAQVIPIALSPILTRLYTPEEFGVFAFYASICAILAVLVTGKYELAVIVSKYEVEAVNLVAVTITISLVISLLLLIIAMMFGPELAGVVGRPGFEKWFYVIPFATFVVACYHSLNFWTNRRSRYRNMAISRLVQSGISGFLQLVAGVFKVGLLGAGLIIGQVIGQLVSTLYLSVSVTAGERKLFQRVNMKRMRCVARKYVNYPKLMLPGQMMSVGAAELPLLVLTVFYGAAVAGEYSLAQRVMAVPMTLVAGAVGDVYRQRAATEYARQGQCLEVFITSLKRLFLVALLPVLPVLFLGPWLFELVFGTGWRGAGEIASVLSVLVFFQTLSSPLSSTVLLPGWLHLDSIWQFIRLVLVGIVFYICLKMEVGYMFMVLAYVGTLSCLYLMHSCLQYKASKGIL